MIKSFSVKKTPFFIVILLIFSITIILSYYPYDNPTNSVPLKVKQEAIKLSYFKRIDPQSDLTPYLQDLCKKIKTKEIDGETPLEDSLFTINLFRKHKNPPKYRLEISAYKETSDLPPFLESILQDFYLVRFKYTNITDDDDYFILEQPLSQEQAYQILKEGFFLNYTNDQTSYLDKGNFVWTMLSNIEKFGRNEYNEKGHFLDTSSMIFKNRLSSGLLILISFSLKNQPQKESLILKKLPNKIESSRIIVDGTYVYKDLTSSEYVIFYKARNSILPTNYSLSQCSLNIGSLPILESK